MSDGTIGAQIMARFRENRKKLYRSKLLHDQWTIAEMADGEYVIHDRSYYEQLVRGSSGLTLYFKTIEAAEKHIEKLSGRALREKVAASKKKPAPKVEGDYKSAAAMFRGLITEGKLSDDDIFAAVQAKFGLDGSRRSYVNWYRKDLQKKGLL